MGDDASLPTLLPRRMTTAVAPTTVEENAPASGTVPWLFLSSFSSSSPSPSTSSTTTTTHAARCLFTIVGLPTALLVVAIVLGIAKTSTGFPYFFFFFFTGGRSRNESSSSSSSSSIDRGLRAWRRKLARAHSRRQQRNNVDDDDDTDDDDDKDDIDDDDGEMSARERASYVPMLAILVGQQLLATAFAVLWNDSNDNAPSSTQQHDGETKHHDVVDVSAAAAVVASFFDPRRRWDRGVHWARASLLTLLLVGAYFWGVVKRPVGVSAIGVPALILVSLRQFMVKLYDPHHNRIRSIDEWAIHEKYWQQIGSEGSHDNESATPNVSLLAKIAVLVDGAIWSVLLPTLLVRAYQRLFPRLFSTGYQSLLGFVKTHLLRGSGNNSNSGAVDAEAAEQAPSRWERVHRIYSRYDVSLSVADEYCLHNPSKASPAMARRVFKRMERAHNHSHSSIAVWLGDDLCLCNFVPPVPRADPRTGRVTMTPFRTTTTTSSVIALETIAFVTLPGDMPHLWVCGTSSALSDVEGGVDGGSSSIVSAMDSFFRLLAFHGHRQRDIDFSLLQMSRHENFGGTVFPVSRRGLRFLVQDPDPDQGAVRRRQRRSTSSRRQGKRVLNVQQLGLTVDQWRWLLQGVPGPHVELWFYGTDYATCPEPFRGLVQALQEDQCAARINVSGADRLPSDDLEELALAVEQNHSVTEMYLGVSSHVVRPSIRDDHRNGRRTAATTYDVDSAAYRILEALARRSAPLDVLELHVSVFTSRTWAFLWESVVPSRALNVKCLKLVTGIGPNLGSALPTDAVNEDEMIRFVCRNQSLCSFEFLNVNAQGTGYTERIADSVGPYLRFNLFRRLVRTLENEPDVELRSRWVATLLVRSATCRNPSWCYHVLQHNASEDWLERPWI